MDERAAVSWLHRRAGFGLSLTDLEAAVNRGSAAEIDLLLSPDAVNAAVAADPWDDADLPFVRDRAQAMQAIRNWLDAMVATAAPTVDRMAWLWHGHFVSALDKVKIARLMVDQIRLFRRGGLGSFAALLHDVTVDPAMLLYLDGTDSTGDSPNENYGREVPELFTLGVGEYTEDDVKAGAVALTGWKVRPGLGTAGFVPRRHDDSPRPYLGVDGVHDVDTPVDDVRDGGRRRYPQRGRSRQPARRRHSAVPRPAHDVHGMPGLARSRSSGRARQTVRRGRPAPNLSQDGTHDGMDVS